MPTLLTPAGRFDLCAIMRAAHALCWIFRTSATGIGTAAIKFHTARVYDRSRLSFALRSVWRQARRQRQTWRLNQPEARARGEALEAATRARWAAEAASIRAELGLASPTPAAATPAAPALPAPPALPVTPIRLPRAA